MSKQNVLAINDVFNVLNIWRHLPSYSLETHVTPYFAVFLRDILKKFGRMHRVLIPEFPVHIRTMYSEEEIYGRDDVSKGKRHSYNVDYVVFSEDKKSVYFVEVKTDMSSISKKQIEYLRRAKCTEFSSLVEGIKTIAPGSRKKQKYSHLLHHLSQPGLDFFDSREYSLVKKHSFPEVVQGFSDAVENLRVTSQHFSKRVVVFIQPQKDEKLSSDDDDFEYIFFDEVADIVERRGGFGELFARHLRNWKAEAGSVDPADIAYIA